MKIINPSLLSFSEDTADLDEIPAAPIVVPDDMEILVPIVVPDDLEIVVQASNERSLYILSKRKYQKNYEKLKRGLNLKKGLHFSCSTCAAVKDLTPLCGMEPEGNCMCRQVKVIKGDPSGINDETDRLWIPDDIHCTVHAGTEWATLGAVCFRLEVHKCTTCQNILAHKYVNADLVKQLRMSWSGKLQQVDLEGVPEQYYIADSENFKILKEADE